MKMSRQSRGDGVTAPWGLKSSWETEVRGWGIDGIVCRCAETQVSIGKECILYHGHLGRASGSRTGRMPMVRVALPSLTWRGPESSGGFLRLDRASNVWVRRGGAGCSYPGP